MVVCVSEVVYRACVRNIKELKKHRRQLNRLVTKALKENDDVIIETYTKLYALLYSAYAEVSFLKLIHEPNAFSDSEIDVIMRQRNLEDKWEKCIELSLIKITNDVNRGVINNKKRTIDTKRKELLSSPKLERFRKTT